MLGFVKRLVGRAQTSVVDEQELTHALTWASPERSGTAPSVRNGHTANVIDSRIFIFGGGDKAELLADLFVFDVPDRQWTQPPCTGVAPPPRSRHCSAVVDCNLYIWGGIGGGVEVHILDTVAMDWSTPIVHGPVPESRFGHTCAAIDAGSAPRIVILGGHNSRQALSDVHVLDVGAPDRMEWVQPEALGEAPICGNRHATVMIDDYNEPLAACLLVFAADMHDTFGTLYALRFRDGLQGNGMRWVAQPTAGRAPLSRARPSLALLDHNVFVVCGVAAGKPLSTVAMLDTRTYTWTLPNIDGTPPPARMGATMSRVGTDLYVFGGSDGKASLRDLNMLVYVTWFTPNYAGRPPPPRVGHTLTFVSSKLHLLGGASHGTATNDLFVLDINTQVWVRPPMYGAPPDALVGHTSVGVGTEMIVWGGGDGKRAHAGLNVVDCTNLLWSRPTASGSEPLAHVGHTAVHVDAKMLVFGGYGQRQYWNELVVLDTGIMVWLRPHTSGSPPEACVLHSASLISAASGWLMVVYGGAFDEQPLDQIVALDVATMRWTNIGNYVWEGPRPEPRFGHGAAAIGTKIFIFGGTTGGEPDTWRSYFTASGAGFVTGYAAGARNDLCVIDLAAREFTTPRYGGQRPEPVYRVAAASYRGKLFLHGGVGSDGQVALLDTGQQESEAQRAASQLQRASAELIDAATAEFFAAEGAAAEGAKVSRGSGRAAEGARGLDASTAAELVNLLQTLGLNKYARLFLRQEIDVESLLQLSDRDLKDMGLSALGARRKLTAAIHRHKLQRLDGGPHAESGASGGAGRSSSGDATGGAGTGIPGDAAGDAAASSGLAVAGTVFRGRYRLNGKTYLGGSARVILGEDEKTGASVAVKVHTSRLYFTREMKLLKHLQSEYVVTFLDAFEDEDLPPTLVLEGGACSLSELLAEGQVTPVERKLVLERLLLALDFVHGKSLVLVDLKPQNVVIFGSLLTLKLIDLECLRKISEPVPFKLTPFYAAPEVATSALETMRLGQLPALEYQRVDGAGGGANRWGPNLQKLALLSENPTLARAVAAASMAANRAGSGSGELNRDDLKLLEAPLKQPNGKPLKASPAMDVWSLGMIAYELFVNEPFFAGCSDDVALQVLASAAPLDVPSARIPDPQAEHLLSKMLQKRPRERGTVETLLRHAYLNGGLDTQQVGGSFAMLHESQQTFKESLSKLQETLPPPGSGQSFSKGSFGAKAGGGGVSFAPPPRTASSFKKPGSVSGMSASGMSASGMSAAGSSSGDKRAKFAQGSVLGRAAEQQGP